MILWIVVSHLTIFGESLFAASTSRNLDSGSKAPCTEIQLNSIERSAATLQENLLHFKNRLERYKVHINYMEAVDKEHGIDKQYFTQEEKKAHQVFFEKGKAFYYRGGRFVPVPDSPPDLQVLGKAKSEPAYLYVMDEDGNFYIGQPTRHSCFLAGMPVASGGHIRIKNGKITYLDNESGHYRPTVEMFNQGVTELNSQGMRGFETRAFDADAANAELF